MGGLANAPSAWIAWTAAALIASLVHVLIDFHIGLYGETSTKMSSLQGANLFLTSLVYGYWIYAVAVAGFGNRSALVSALVVAALWAFLWNGVIGLMISPPPSSAFPYQDIAHVSSIVFGAGASAAIWRASRSIATEASWTMLTVTGLILVSAFVVQSVLGLRHA